MLNLALNSGTVSEKALNKLLLNIEGRSIKDKVKLLILRDLINVNWQINYANSSVNLTPPTEYNKEIIKESMAVRRNEIIENNRKWIDKRLDLARQNLANGSDVFNSKIIPVIEVCETQKQHDLFRIYRYFWSSPYSEYVGRRIKIIIRDAAIKSRPVIGIAALGSPIMHIPERDEWIGWDLKTRTNNLIYAMDAYVIGALPPYNYILGGKLISYILASNEVRQIYASKYEKKKTILRKRRANSLAAIFTTSLFGKSSQYNRLKYNKDLLYIPIGSTKGYGTLHLTQETFSSMIEFLHSEGVEIGNRFGDGPSWRMRVIRSVGAKLGFEADLLLQHSYKRSIYCVPLAKNYSAYLRGEEVMLKQYNLPLSKLVNYWKKRWLSSRKSNLKAICSLITFNKNDFSI
jgi:hypothetical protein